MALKQHHYNWRRIWAMFRKEFIQMRRDRTTFAMIIAIPLMQVILFGYVINTNPRHLPTAIVAADHSEFTRAFIAGLEQTNYFTITDDAVSEAEAEKMLATGKVQFVLNIPIDFTHDLVRGNRPKLLLQADATDPAATSNALAAVDKLAQTIFMPLTQGSLNYLSAIPSSIDMQIQAKYNPEQVTQYNVVPGLLGVVLTMTMVMITSIAITRERERGTMENLLATPIRPLEVMIGKIMPYILVGYIQFSLIFILAFTLFAVPVLGSLILLFVCALPFIAVNLAVGLTISTIAKNQLQAVQMTIFYFLPSILLSGFMFPYRGMPEWAQYLGEILPLTHFLRIVRGIMLKGNTLTAVWGDVLPLFILLLLIILLGVKRYKQTLD